MLSHGRIVSVAVTLLGVGASLIGWGLRLAASDLGIVASPQRAEQLVLAAAGVGIAAAGTWLCVATVVCLADLVRNQATERAGLLRPRVVQHALLRACGPALGAAVVCAGGPVAADTGDLDRLDRLDGLPLPERPVVTMPVGPPGAPPGAAGQDATAGRSAAPPGRIIRTGQADRAVHTVQPGECLWSIATDLLAAHSSVGRPTRPEVLPPASDVDGAWRRLYAANRSRVGPAPDVVQPGTRLTVPRSLRPSPHLPPRPSR